MAPNNHKKLEADSDRGRGNRRRWGRRQHNSAAPSTTSTLRSDGHISDADFERHLERRSNSLVWEFNHVKGSFPWREFMAVEYKIHGREVPWATSEEASATVASNSDGDFVDPKAADEASQPDQAASGAANPAFSTASDVQPSFSGSSWADETIGAAEAEEAAAAAVSIPKSSQTAPEVSAVSKPSKQATATESNQDSGNTSGTLDDQVPALGAGLKDSIHAVPDPSALTQVQQAAEAEWLIVKERMSRANPTQTLLDVAREGIYKKHGAALPGSVSSAIPATASVTVPTAVASAPPAATQSARSHASVQVQAPALAAPTPPASTPLAVIQVSALIQTSVPTPQPVVSNTNNSADSVDALLAHFPTGANASIFAHERTPPNAPTGPRRASGQPNGRGVRGNRGGLNGSNQHQNTRGNHQGRGRGNSVSAQAPVPNGAGGQHQGGNQQGWRGGRGWWNGQGGGGGRGCQDDTSGGGRRGRGQTRSRGRGDW